MNIAEYEALAEAALTQVLTDEFAAMIGKAKGMCIYAEHERKRVMSELMMQSNEKTIQSREDWARQQDAFKDAVKAEARANSDYEELRTKWQTARVAIEAWQTACANNRQATSVR